MKIHVLSIHEKKVNARSTKHQVHFSINHAISILICTLIDIIFVIFKNDRGILDYNKVHFIVTEMKEDTVNSNANYMVEIENMYASRNILKFILLQIIPNYKL